MRSSVFFFLQTPERDRRERLFFLELYKCPNAHVLAKDGIVNAVSTIAGVSALCTYGRWVPWLWGAVIAVTCVSAGKGDDTMIRWYNDTMV